MNGLDHADMSQIGICAARLLGLRHLCIGNSPIQFYNVTQVAHLMNGMDLARACRIATCSVLGCLLYVFVPCTNFEVSLIISMEFETADLG